MRTVAIDWKPIDSFTGNTGSETLTQYRPCPVCGSVRDRGVLCLTDFQFYSDSDRLPKRADVRQAQCCRCSALFMNPCYSEYGFSVLFAESGMSYGSSTGRMAEIATWLADRGLVAPGKVFLDAGCFDGGFLAGLPAGVKKVGVDIDAPAIARARQRFAGTNAQFILGDFETFRCATQPDVISMFHVLEHLPRPIRALANLAAVSGPETHLVVEVPVLENGKTNDINGFFSVQHMTHFTRSSLVRCLAAGGWTVVEEEVQHDYNGLRIVARVTEGAEQPELAPDWGSLAVLNEYLSHWHKALAAVERRLKDLPITGRFAIWGAGAHTEFLYQCTTLFRARPNVEWVLIDTDPLKWGKSWRGVPIHNANTVDQIVSEYDWLIVSSYGSQASIAEAAVSFGFHKDSMKKIYESIRRY